MMNEEIKRSVWQISGGPTSRSYVDVFLKYGVGLIGPGDAGEWKSGRKDEEFNGGFVRRFASEVKIGDVFLLRTSISKIAAIGLVASGYQYLNQFDDVNGWDLQHTRRVRWCKLPEEYGFGRAIFGGNPSRLSHSWDEEVIKYTRNFLNSPPVHWQTAPLPEIPAEEPMLEEVPSYLKGIIAEVQDLAQLYREWQKTGDQPTEDEIVSHFIVPFFRSLGWPPEQIAIKWRDIDVAVFTKFPRTPGNCHLIVEAKRSGSGLEGALSQGKRYLKQIGAACDIVVSDGVRYRMYTFQKNDFVPIAYANLTWLKREAVELFSRMKRP
jgi:hypothetical protein